MSKITKQELYTMVRNLENWMSDIKIDVFNQPNVTLPKSTRDDVEVGSRLDSLEARMDMVEKMLKKEPEPEPQNIRKVVFDYLIDGSGGKHEPRIAPSDYDVVEQLSKIGNKSYLFKAKQNHWEAHHIYIGHYE
jgi:hypothetical protein